MLFAAAAAVVNATLVGGLADSVQAGSNASSELAQYVQLDTMGGLKAYSPPQATSAAAGTGVGAGVGALLQAIGGAGAGLKEFLLGHLSWIFQVSLMCIRCYKVHGCNLQCTPVVTHVCMHARYGMLVEKYLPFVTPWMHGSI